MISRVSTVTMAGGADATMSSRTTRTPDHADTVLTLVPATESLATSMRAFIEIGMPAMVEVRPASAPVAVNAGTVTMAEPEAMCTGVSSIDTSGVSSSARAITRRSPAAIPFCSATETRKPLSLVTSSLSTRPVSSDEIKSGVPGVAGGFKFVTRSELT